MLNEPEITVIPSAVGLVCAGILNPAGVLRRIVNGPSLPGSPSRTAILAPAGNDGGASLHFKSAAANMTCSDFAIGFSSRARASEEIARAAANKARDVIFFIMRCKLGESR